MNPVKAGRAQDAFCDEFLASHSEYLDGQLAPMRAARMSAHAEMCASCGRYDRIVRRGLALARELPDVDAGADFELRLEHRLLHMRDAEALAPRAPWTGIAATLGVAAALALLAWSPLLLDRPERSADAVQPGTERIDDAGYASAAPLLVERAWYPVVIPQTPAHQAAAFLATFPGPYSPLVVTPPAHRSVRTVSSEHVD